MTEITAYQILIRSDIDISYPAYLQQDYTDIIELRRSPLIHLPKYKNKLVFGKNQLRDIALYSQSDFHIARREAEYGLEIKGVVSFHWKSDAGEIYYIPGEAFTIPLLRYWLLRGALIFYLLLQGKYRFLHAGAVRAGGKSLLFSAHSHGGKSTLTNYFITKGHPLISDDKVPVYEESGRLYTVTAYPYHRPHRALEDLGFFVDKITPSATPIDVIYKLKGSKPDQDVKINEIYGIEKYKALHFSNELGFLYDKRADMQYLARVAKQIPIYEVAVPWDREKLPEVYEAIIKHSKTLRNTGG